MNDTKRSKRKTAVSAQKASSHSDSTLQKTLRASLWSFLITVAVSLVLLLAGTAVAYSTSDPTSLISPIAYVSLYMSAFFGGFASAKLNKRSPYLTCALCSGVFLLLGVLASAAIPQSNESLSSFGETLILRLAEVLMFFVGTVIGIKSFSSKGQTRHKKYKK